MNLVMKGKAAQRKDKKIAKLVSLNMLTLCLCFPIFSLALVNPSTNPRSKHCLNVALAVLCARVL